MLSPLPGTNTMIIGESGVGKTYALRTLLDAGLTPFCIFTEPRFEVVGDTPPDKFHWAYVAPSLEDLSGIERKLQDIASMSYEAMLKKSDVSRSRENRLIPFIQLLNDFKCERTGKSFGPVKSWGTDRVLVLDTLTGFCKMVWSAVIGSKPVKAMHEYGIAQDQALDIIDWLCTGTRCHFVMNCHAEVELDEIQGGRKIMASGIGKKLSPLLPRNFSDVALAHRPGAKFFWSTSSVGAALKATHLPLSEEIRPSFTTIINSWKAKGGIIEPQGPADPSRPITKSQEPLVKAI